VEQDAKTGPAVLFPAGPSTLDGPEAAKFWSFVGSGEDELAVLARQRQIWNSVFASMSADDAVRGRTIGDGAPQLRPVSSDDPNVVTDLFDGLIAAHTADELGFELLPVKVFGAAGSEDTYQVREQQSAELIADTLAPSRPPGGEAGRLRVQVLNGVGTPGIGRQIDQRLDGEPVRVTLTDNAVNFEQATTRILIYDDNPAIREAAERVRERLGVGTIELSRQPQSVVDLTIVVGADFTVD
jgi:hypothetical protein